MYSLLSAPNASIDALYPSSLAATTAAIILITGSLISSFYVSPNALPLSYLRIMCAMVGFFCFMPARIS